MPPLVIIVLPGYEHYPGRWHINHNWNFNSFLYPFVLGRIGDVVLGVNQVWGLNSKIYCFWLGYAICWCLIQTPWGQHMLSALQVMKKANSMLGAKQIPQCVKIHGNLRHTWFSFWKPYREDNMISCLLHFLLQGHVELTLVSATSHQWNTLSRMDEPTNDPLWKALEVCRCLNSNIPIHDWGRQHLECCLSGVSDGSFVAGDSTWAALCLRCHRNYSVELQRLGTLFIVRAPRTLIRTPRE